MNKSSLLTKPLAELQSGEEAVFFALLTAKEPLNTRDHKPYFRVAFRDALREVAFPIWQDSPWMPACKNEWKIDCFYKLQAVYRETQFGGQLDIVKIRPVRDEDSAEGFSPLMCLARSQRNPQEMFEELIALSGTIVDAGLRELTQLLLNQNRESWLRLPAEASNHHVYVGGLLEHTLHVAQTAQYLAARYLQDYPHVSPPLCADCVLAGAILHDVGKLQEIQPTASGASFTPHGDLIGHIVLGRDLVREAAAHLAILGRPVDDEKLLRLEHVVLSHQRLPEFGSPKPPMTLEAMLVHYANEIDVKYAIMATILEHDKEDSHTTSNRNLLKQKLFRGLPNNP